MAVIITRIIRRAKRRTAIQRNAFVLRDYVGYPARHQPKRRRIIALAQYRQRFAAKSTDLAIRQNWFQSITHFEAIFMVAGHQQNQDAPIVAFRPNSPFLVELIGEILDGLIVECLDGYHGDLRAGLLLHFEAQIAQPVAGIRIQDVREIAYVTFRPKVLDLLGSQTRRECREA
jgi:hypothetical protein